MKVYNIRLRENRLVPRLPSEVDPHARKKLRDLREEILSLLTRQRFISFIKQPKLHFDNQLNCLWLLHEFNSTPEQMFQHVARLQIYAFRHWEIPSMEELRSIAREDLFRNHEKFRGATILSRDPATSGPGYRTITFGGAVGETEATDALQMVLPIHRVAQRDVFAFILNHGLIPRDVTGVGDKMHELYLLTKELNEKNRNTTEPTLPSLKALQNRLMEGDWIRARLPILEPSYLTDMEKGLWELYQPVPPTGKGWIEMTLDPPWEARNPELDVRKGVIAIDFGTSSTVVACRENGKTTLLRVGMPDFFRKPAPADYQNPTVLEFIHLPRLLAAWTGEAHQPLTRWDDFHFSHEALKNFRENEANQRIVASMLTNIKQWPLSPPETRSRRITDQNTGLELEIHATDAPMPVRGQPIAVSREDPFDPIELYAYYLGLFINHRSNGLFLEYYMTFPVTYPREIKRTILTAFSRGLMRSLPESLMASPMMERFQMREEASEPAAYAACALEELDIVPTLHGTAYAVFDFGGGSTDFDFGLYRMPTPEETEQGYERVIERFGASGDMYLGGENLVANLAYIAFKQNLESCREHQLPFSIPPEAEKFPGHELFLDNSHVAQTNTALLTAKVRQMWENFRWDLEDPHQSDPNHKKSSRRQSDRIADALSQFLVDENFALAPGTLTLAPPDNVLEVQIEFLNRAREKVPVLFRIDRDQINHFLVKRVGKGIHRFFIAMKRAFENRNLAPREVHILQAGNASRALLVQALFAAMLQNKMFKWCPPPEGIAKNTALEEIQRAVAFPHFVVHRPPVGDPDNPYCPTAKTGVAIGLLKLIPGETLLALNATPSCESGEAPFRIFVGRLNSGYFQPILHQNGPYREWQELGVPTRGAFVLLYSSSPQAGMGNLPRGSQELEEKNVTFGPGHLKEKRLFIQAIGPTEVELCLADSLEQILQRPEEVLNQMRLALQ
ncbi:MAG: hypothetical protein HQL98_08915 [Magnetococcales bacterium]|nr:hypothetical protein [Magnetococcales bacterium]